MHIIGQKAMQFAIRCVHLSRHLQKEDKQFIISKQIVRSGTAIGAMVSEAKFAESRIDFRHKYKIALKEANETLYWLNLLHKTDLIDNNLFHSFKKDCDVLIRMLVTAVKKLNIPQK